MVVSLTPEQERILNAALQSGQYRDTTAVLDEALHALEERRRTEAPSVSQTEKMFRALSDQWNAETAHISSFRDLFMHPAYQQIIGLGSEVVPALLRDLQRQPKLWFWALYSITRQNPVGNDGVGDIDKMTNAWIDWGRERGLVNDGRR